MYSGPPRGHRLRRRCPGEDAAVAGEGIVRRRRSVVLVVLDADGAAGSASLEPAGEGHASAVGVACGRVRDAERLVLLDEDGLLEGDVGAGRGVAATVRRVVVVAVGAGVVEVALLGQQVLRDELLAPVALAPEVDLELERRLSERPTQRRLVDRAEPLGVLGEAERNRKRERGTGDGRQDEHTEEAS